MNKLYKYIFNEKTASNTIIIGFVISFLMLILFLFKGSWSFNAASNIREEKVGQFGDFIGGVIGTLFSLVGVILFYISLKEQRKDFKTNQNALKMQLEAFNQQIKEFKLQRDELTETRKIFEQQTKTMRNQQFESNFYSLLNVFISNQNKFLEKNLFQNVITKMKTDVPTEDFQETSNKIHANYFNEYLANRADLAKYFMTLYRLFKIVEECSYFNVKEKEYYHKIIRSQINKDELLVLYYNYHSDFGKKPVPIALKYDYFKHLETFSKLEFEITFGFSNSETVHFNKVLYKISELIIRNFQKAKQLSENKTKEEIEIFPYVFIGIYIDELIEIKLAVKNNVHDIEGIELSKYKEIIKLILIDTIYSKNFKKFEISSFEESTTTSTSQTDYNFKFISSND